MIKKENYNKNTKKSDKVAKNEENEKISWKAGNMLYPLPVVMVYHHPCLGRNYMYQSTYAVCLHKT